MFVKTVTNYIPGRVYCSWGFFGLIGFEWVMLLEYHTEEENSIKLDNINFSMESLSIFCWYYQMICKLSCETFVLEARHIWRNVSLPSPPPTPSVNGVWAILPTDWKRKFALSFMCCLYPWWISAKFSRGLVKKVASFLWEKKIVNLGEWCCLYKV